MKKVVTHLIYFVFGLQFLFAQQPVSIHLTEKDGVPDNEFYDSIEDDEGYIWFAADKGLFRFDGVNYKKIQHPEQNGLSVFNLNKDANGTIWYNNISGQVFYIENEKAVLFNDYKDPFKGELAHLSVTNNLIVLYFKFRLLIFNRHTKQQVYSVNINEEAGLIEPYVIDDILYYGTISNVIKLDLVKLEVLKKTPILKHYPRYIQSSIFTKIDDNKLIYFTRNEISGVDFYRISTDFEDEIETLEEDFPNVKIIRVKTINNQLWVCAENGVYICEVKGNRLTIKQHLFPNQFITNVLVDKHSNYWFSSVNNALFVVPNLAINKVEINFQNDKIKALSLGDKDELLINTINYKLHKYNLSSKEKLTYLFKGKPDIHLSKYHPFTSKYLTYTNLGTYVLNSDFSEGKTQRIIVQDGTIKDVSFATLNKTLVSTANDLKIYNYDFKTKTNKLAFREKIRGYAVYYNANAKENYFASMGGFLVVNDNNIAEEIKYNDKSIYIKDIAQTQDGVIWCSSFKNGLYAIKNKKIVKHFTADNGLLSNTNPFIKSKNNNLWIAGEKGVQCLNTTTGSFQNLTKREGIVSYNYNGLEIVEDNVYISSLEQLIYFNEDDVFKPYNTPEVFISNLSIGNVQQPIKSSYTLKEEASAINIHFNAIGYQSSSSGKFEYRLIGFQDNWTESITGLYNIQYNALLEGDYVFQVRNITANKQDVVTKEIKFFVTKPFWEKTSFYVFLTLLLVGLVTLFYKRKLKARETEKNKLLEQLEINNELVNLKLENLRSQMNPHFVFNALNSIQDYILSNQKKLAGDYLGKFADLIRTYLNHSTIGKLTLEEELSALNMYLELEKLRFEDLLEYTITVDKTINTALIKIPTMLIQPYVENALKHGLLHKKTDRKLSISINKISEELIECTIKDNGVGRERSKSLNQKRIREHNSFATKATHQRLDLLNYGRLKKISVKISDLKENNQPTGTKVVLQIPIL